MIVLRALTRVTHVDSFRMTTRNPMGDSAGVRQRHPGERWFLTDGESVTRRDPNYCLAFERISRRVQREFFNRDPGTPVESEEELTERRPAHTAAPLAASSGGTEKTGEADRSRRCGISQRMAARAERRGRYRFEHLRAYQRQIRRRSENQRQSAPRLTERPFLLRPPFFFGALGSPRQPAHSSGSTDGQSVVAASCRQAFRGAGGAGVRSVLATGAKDSAPGLHTEDRGGSRCGAEGGVRGCPAHACSRAKRVRPAGRLSRSCQDFPSGRNHRGTASAVASGGHIYGYAENPANAGRRAFRRPKRVRPSLRITPDRARDRVLGASRTSRAERRRATARPRRPGTGKGDAK